MAAAAKPAKLVKYLAVGRLGRDANGDFAANKHVVICSLLANDSDSAAKSYKTRISDIMTKAAAKLQMGKRMCLTSDDPGTEYELHLLAEEVDENPGVVIVYFVATDSGFGKAQSITKLLAEFKTGLYANGAGTIASAGNNSLQSRMAPTLKSLASKFGSNKIAEVSNKVEEVKAVMRENVDLALSNVDKLEVMEEKAADMEKEAKSFERGANKLAWQMRCRNWKLVMLMVLLVVAILTAIIYPLAKH